MNLSNLRHRLHVQGWRLWALLALLAYTLAGFFLVPWMLDRQLVAFAESRLERPATVDRIRFNPFALSLEVDGFALREPDGAPIGSIGEVYVNFELSSLARRAWTFSALRLAEPYVKLVRFEDGTTNLGGLAASFERTGSPAPPDPDRVEAGDGALPRLIVQSLQVQGGALDVTDRSLETDFDTHIEPIELELTDFNTLPDEAGEHSFRVVTEYGANITWTGELQPNPPRLRGHVAVAGERPRLLWRYFQDRVGFEIADGRVTLGLDLDVASGANGLLVRVENLDYELSDLLIRPKGRDRDVLRVPHLTLSGGRLQWPERTAHLDEARISGGALDIRRNRDGAVDLVELFAPKRGTPAEASAAPPPVVSATSTPSGNADTSTWLATLGALVVEDFDLRFEDNTRRKPLSTGFDGLNVNATGISTEPGAEFHVDVAGDLTTGGRLQVSGDAGLDPLQAELDLDLESASLAPLNSLLAEFSRLSLKSGALSLAGHLRHDETETAAFSGRASVDELVTQDTVLDERFVAWRKVSVPAIELSLDGGSLAIERIALQAPYGKLVVKEDGTTNLDDLFATPDAASAAGTEASGSTPVPASEGNSASGPRAALSVHIGEITVDEGSANFSDQSLPLPFTTAIHSLAGTITNVDSAADKRSNVSLKGTVDESGRVGISGSLTPYSPATWLDLDVAFSNLHMPRLSPYSGKFAGRKIAGGTLNLDLDYRIDHNLLKSTNRIVIDRLELGDRVESPDAVSLPLDLAIALLEDSDGQIHLDVPVSGNIGDPNFHYGAVVGRTLRNVIARLATAPFKLLGALLPGGGNGEKLEFVAFEPGSAALADSERTDLNSVAAAIAKRPQLLLAIPGAYSAATDRAALQREKLLGTVDTQVGTQAPADDERARRRVLEALYLEAFSPTELDNLKAANTHTDSGAPPGLDEDAYLASLRRILADEQFVSTEELEQLARNRAGAIYDYLTTQAEAATEQLRIGEVTTVEPDAGGSIRLQLEIGSRAG